MIWADFENLCRWRYRVMPLNPALGTYTQKLQREMGTVCRLSASAGRPDFYEVDAPGGWYYVHVHHPSRTVYVVAHSPADVRGGRQSMGANTHTALEQIGV